MWLYLLAVGMILAGGCSRAPARDPAVVQDALEYVGRIRDWEAVEAEVLRAIRDVQRSQYVDDDYVVATLGSVMADVALHLEEIGRYRPRTPAVTEVHDRYRTAWRDLHASFQSIIAAMEQKDYLALSRGTESMKRSRGELITVAAALNLLLKETGLTEAPPGPSGS